MTDLVERLRRAEKFGGHYAEAAGEIELLRKTLRGLALQHMSYEHGFGPCVCEWHNKAREILGDNLEFTGEKR